MSGRWSGSSSGNSRSRAHGQAPWSNSGRDGPSNEDWTNADYQDGGSAASSSGSRDSWTSPTSSKAKGKGGSKGNAGSNSGSRWGGVAPRILYPTAESEPTPRDSAEAKEADRVAKVDSDRSRNLEKRRAPRRSSEGRQRYQADSCG